MRLAVIFHRLGPYHCARLEAIARHCEVTAIELAAETAEYDWAKIHGANGYARVTLFPDGDSRAATSGDLEQRIGTALDDCRPDAVAIPGWSDPGAFAALLWCARTSTPAVLMSESTAHDEPRVAWKEFVKRRVVSVYSTALVGGRRHSDYLQQLGMSADRIFTGYDVVDNQHFASGEEKAETLKVRNAEMGKGPISASQRFSVSDFSAPSASQSFSLSAFAAGPYFLASARFIPKKNLFTLLRAYAQYRAGVKAEMLKSQNAEMVGSPTISASQIFSVSESPSPWDLVLLGDGPLRPSLEAELFSLSLHEHVQMPGFKQYDELPAFYARAGAFVHASSSEQWGLVVNEAIAAGLPVLVSNRCGCVPELVREGVNGFSFDPEDPNELTQLMARIFSLPEGERKRLGNASREIALQHQPASFGEGLRRAADLALSLPRKRAGVFDTMLLQSLMRR